MLNKEPQRDVFEQPQEVVDPLHLDLTDEEIVSTVKDSIRESVSFYNDRKLYDKQKKNVEYYFGRQKLYSASTKSRSYKENIIYEGLARQKPIALSRMPDLTVKDGGAEGSKKIAEDLSGVFNSDIRKRKNRKLLGLAFKQEPLYYYACIKALWNPELGMFGDYEFINVHPDNVIWDHNCSTNNANDMRFVIERVSITLKELIMTFPDKEEEIKKEFGWEDNEKSSEKKMASMVDIFEAWFHWYKLKGKESERIDGVTWIYGNLMLKKMKNPYFDYQGKRKTFSMIPEEKNEATMDDIYQMLDNERGGEENDVIFNNYFQDPEKPYFFMVYENMGEHPISDTSRVEQVLEFQDIVNQDGTVISDMNIRSRGKDIFDTNAIEQKTLDEIDIYDIDQVLGLDVPQGSNMGAVHSRIEQKPATAQQYRSMQENRQKAFEMLGVGATTRGLHEPDSTLGESQMSREADFGLIDDIVEDTINACAEWQSRWAMQFIKLFYTKPHMRHILGKDGEVVHTRLTQDMVDDGMEVVVSASGVDKMMRKRMAIENMKLGIGDPLSFYEDTEQSNPKERAKRTMLAQMAPQMFFQEYLNDELGPDNPPIPGADEQGVPVEQPPAPVGGGGYMGPMGGGDPLGLFQ